MYSEKAYHIADNCRFCWMCRHVCPVGLKTGKEMNTPRAKGLLVAMEKRGFPLDESGVRAIYECMLCGSCSNDCVTGFEPPVFIREARTEALAAGMVPENVAVLIDRILETGVMYDSYQEDQKLAGIIKKHAKKAPVLLFLGACARYRVPGMAANFIRLLERAGIEFMGMDREPPTGSELYDLAGSVEEVRKQARECAEQINAAEAEKLVVLDSYLAETLKHQYPAWGCRLSCEVLTATEFAAQLVENGKLKPANLNVSVTIHDSSRLARDLKETEPVRQLAGAAGCEIREMFLHRDLSKCCGSALFALYEPELAAMTSEGRWEDAKRTKAQYLVAECPQALDVLGLTDGGDMKLTDIFTLVEEACERGNRQSRGQK